jgi:hypothetical protein
MARIVGVSALVELGAGVSLLVDPALVVTLLLRMPVDATAQVLGRGLGVALVALAAALLPGRGSGAVAAPVFQAALIYNVLTASVLACVSIVRHLGGLVLWAAVAPHAVLGVLLLTTWQRQYQRKTTAQ